MDETLGVIIIFLIVYVGCSADFQASENFTHFQQLDKNYQLHWKFNESHIIFKTTVRTSGYIGFGISPNGGMVNSDIVIGWVKNGQGHVTDRHAVDNAEPLVDRIQDWNLLSAQEADNVTTLIFMRALDTCDPNDVSITKDTSRVIFSYHPSDPDMFIPYHGSDRRGTRSLMLLDPVVDDVDNITLTDDVIYIDLLNDNFSVPVNETYYNCRAKKLNNISGKHHMIRYEPLIQAGHESLVHHIVVYSCTRPIDDQYLEVDYLCYDNVPHDLFSCDQVFIAWAIGGQAFDYPAHVGHSIEADDGSYFMLETHYNNPDQLAGVIDSSGLRLSLTKSLRDYDAAVLDTGVNTDAYQIIPPFEQSFLSNGYCPSHCLTQGLQDKKIKVFAILLHAHLLGRKIRARHFRNDTELPPLMEDNKYDFNYQQMRLLPQERIMEKGDSLLTECIYDSTQRTQVTYGGLPSTSEMCQTFLLYYPKVSLSRCTTRQLYQMDGQFVVNYLFERIDSIDWTKSDVRAKFQSDVMSSSFISLCYFSSKQVTINITSTPEIKHFYTPESTCP